MSNDIKKEVTKLQEKIDFITKMLESGVEETHPAVVNALEDIAADSSYISDQVLEKDLEKVDGETWGLDEIFQGHPASEFQEKVFEELEGGSDEEEKEENEAYSQAGNNASGEVEEEVEDITLESFVETIVEDLPFAEEQAEYKEDFSTHLLGAIKTLKSRRGHAEFIVNVSGDNVDGKIQVTGDTVSVTIGEHEYVFEEQARVAGYSEEEEEDYEDFECSGDPTECDCDCDLPVEDEPEEPLEYKKERTLYEYIENLDEDYYAQVHEILQDIEELISGKLDNKEELQSRDYDLIRYYFKNQANNENDVETLSNNALVLAWNFRRFSK